jgi:hypothetical protein
MDETWEVIPLIGLGPLRLGMSRNEIDAFSGVLGAVYAYDEKPLPNGKVVYNEYRDLESPFVTYMNGRVVDISIDHHSRFDIRYHAISVFKDRAQNLLQAFEKEDGRALWGLGGVVFPRLSLGVKGFVIELGRNGRPVFWEDTEEQPPRILTIAMAGAYDEFLSHYHPVSLA